VPESTGGFAFLGEEEVWRGWLLRLTLSRFADPAGVEFCRDVVHHPGAVAIVAVDDNRSVTLVRQFRPAVGRTILEIPAGSCDVAGEAPEATARRELAEEAGLAAETFEELVRTHNTPGYSTQLTVIYLATGLRPVATQRAGAEEDWMTLEQIPLDDLDRLLDDGPVDETTLLGLLLARRALARRG
jgi:8-oxo-dGTP pyrophosphatase MutT (NUDIX family)